MLNTQCSMLPFPSPLSPPLPQSLFIHSYRIAHRFLLLSAVLTGVPALEVVDILDSFDRLAHIYLSTQVHTSLALAPFHTTLP